MAGGKCFSVHSVIADRNNRFGTSFLLFIGVFVKGSVRCVWSHLAMCSREYVFPVEHS